jgi:hypothetical protein
MTSYRLTHTPHTNQCTPEYNRPPVTTEHADLADLMRELQEHGVPVQQPWIFKQGWYQFGGDTWKWVEIEETAPTDQARIDPRAEFAGSHAFRPGKADARHCDFGDCGARAESPNHRGWEPQEVEFPTPICPDAEARKPHAAHRIAGTWRDDCPGVEPVVVDGASEGEGEMTEYGMYGNRQDEFGYLAEASQAEIVEYCHTIASLMDYARSRTGETVLVDGKRIRETRAARVPTKDEYRSAVWARYYRENQYLRMFSPARHANEQTEKHMRQAELWSPRPWVE